MLSWDWTGKANIDRGQIHIRLARKLSG
ncbi:hypothetical protein U2A4042370185 [Corynebacterium striatum]|nr:hypothetical protein U2A4042370185 [Corynebacterium striatum]